MTKARIVLGTALGAALICGGMAMAQKPVENVSGKKHPNLAAAQRLSEEAWQKIGAAQQANAAKAKDLLDQVNKELKLAAEAANKNHK